MPWIAIKECQNIFGQKECQIEEKACQIECHNIYIYMCVCAKYTVRVPNILPNDMSETMAEQWIRVIITQSKVIKVSKLILGTSFSPNTKDPLKIKITP